jgi:hypothetical protein
MNRKLLMIGLILALCIVVAPAMAAVTCDALCKDAQGNCLSAGATCRAAAGPCDVAEVCKRNGNDITCPADAFAPSTTTCTGISQGGLCDAQDYCLGTANTCVDKFKASTVVCRADAGQCDIEEKCTGTSGTCPQDAFEPAATTCTGTSQGGLCDNDAADHCLGTANSCVDVFKAADTACTDDGNQCTNDVCSGTSGTCMHPVKGNGAVCNDGKDCTSGDVCTDGVCAGTPGTESCNGLDDDCDGTVDDGNPGGGVACDTVKQGVGEATPHD